MNIEKYPNYFLVACILYAVVFLACFAYFIVPALDFGFAYAEFSLILLLMFLPMVLLALYHFVGEIEILWGKEKIIRMAVCVLIVIDTLITAFLMMLLI